jgi:tRNA(Arg) A34 adenosine deaminase TadA
MRYPNGYKLSWSRDKWLHRPTQELVDNEDPRVPRTVDEMKRRRREWLVILSHATINQGYYRREVDMSTARAVEPTFTATWHANGGPVVTLVRAHDREAYEVCVRHFQANFRGVAEPLIVDEVSEYLERSRDRFTRGSDEYYARKCLEAALTAYRSKNYGIGALAVVYEAKTAREWSAGNCMVSGSGVIDHAETRALLRIANAEPPDATYPLESAPPHGLSVFGTLEPCPMCACVMTNAGATRSVSTVEDGHLIEKSGFRLSDGAANVLGHKSKTQPAIWQSIQQGRPLKFELLRTADAELQSLSRRIFEETRKTIDKDLSDRTHLGHADAVRNLYRARFQ